MRKTQEKYKKGFWKKQQIKKNTRGTVALMTAGKSLRKVMYTPWALSYTQLQWTVMTDKQGRVEWNTIYNSLVIHEGNGDELHIPVQLSGWKRERYLDPLASKEVRTQPSVGLPGTSKPCCPSCLLPSGLRLVLEQSLCVWFRLPVLAWGCSLWKLGDFPMKHMVLGIMKKKVWVFWGRGSSMCIFLTI